jgi:hypothetical protein
MIVVVIGGGRLGRLFRAEVIVILDGRYKVGVVDGWNILFVFLIV